VSGYWLARDDSFLQNCRTLMRLQHTPLNRCDLGLCVLRQSRLLRGASHVKTRDRSHLSSLSCLLACRQVQYYLAVSISGRKTGCNLAVPALSRPFSLSSSRSTTHVHTRQRHVRILCSSHPLSNATFFLLRIPQYTDSMPLIILLASPREQFIKNTPLSPALLAFTEPNTSTIRTFNVLDTIGPT